MKTMYLAVVCFFSPSLVAMDCENQSVVAMGNECPSVFCSVVRAQDAQRLAQVAQFYKQQAAQAAQKDREERAPWTLSQPAKKPCFTFAEKCLIGTGLLVFFSGGGVAVCGAFSGNVCCLAGGLGCMAATEAGVGVGLCIGDRRKKSLPRQYNERPVVTAHFHPIFVREQKNEKAVEMPGQVPE